MNTVTKGARNELVASIDLLDRGFHVFRSVSPACPSDLTLVNAAGQAATVEVRTAQKWNNVFCFSLGKIRSDILAVVVAKRVYYTFWTDWGRTFFESITAAHPNIILSMEQIKHDTPLPPSVPRRYDPIDRERLKLDSTERVA